MESRQFIHISSGTIVRTILIVLGFYLLYVLRDIALVILTAITITAAIEPANKALVKRGIPRAFAVILVFLTMGILCVGALYFFLPSFIQDTINLLNSLPKYADSTDLWNPLSQTPIGSALSGFSLREILNNLSAVFADVTGGIFTTVSGVFGGIVSFVMIVVLAFYFSVQEDGIGSFLKIVTPIQHEKYILDLWKRSEQKIGLWLQGQFILGLIVGVLTYLGLAVLGVKSAMFLAFTAMVLELIPIFGLFLALVPALAVALTDGGITLGVMVLGLYLIVQQFETHLIYPLVVRKIIGIPPIVVIIALLVGLQLAGFLGVLLSVPFAAVLVEVMNDLEKRKVNIS